jgi:hypothetical protein
MVLVVFLLNALKNYQQIGSKKVVNIDYNRIEQN